MLMSRNENETCSGMSMALKTKAISEKCTVKEFVTKAGWTAWRQNG